MEAFLHGLKFVVIVIVYEDSRFLGLWPSFAVLLSFFTIVFRPSFFFFLSFFFFFSPTKISFLSLISFPCHRLFPTSRRSSSKMVTTNLITKASQALDRYTLLRLLGVDPRFPHLAFIPSTTPLKPTSSSRCRSIHATSVPFLEFGTIDNRCAGAKLIRYKRATTAVPCFDKTMDATSSVCKHCNELWAHQDEDGFYCFDPTSMAEATKCYAVNAKTDKQSHT